MKASEVRSQWKETLDKAVAGETIVFDRTGVVFELKAKPYINYYRVSAKNKTNESDATITTEKLKDQWNNDDFVTINTKPQVITKIDKEKFDKAEPIITYKNKDLQFCKHNAVKGFCKMGCK